MIKTRINNEYKDVVKIFCGGTLQKEIIKVWSREAQEYVYESEVEYTGTLPITITANGAALIDYRIYGADGGVGEGVDITGLSEPLCGIQTYTDSLDLSTGILTRMIKKLVLTGEEDWHKSSVRVGSAFAYLRDIAPNAVPFSPIVCTHLDNKPYQYYRYGVGLIDENSLNLWLFNISVTITDFKSYLAAQYAAGTPVTVWYVLAKPDVSTIHVPSGLTGTIEGYLIQDGTPTPETPIYPTANGVKQADGTYSIEYGYKLPMIVHSELKDIGDTVSVNGALWDIVNYNNDFTRATLLRHELMPDMVYSAKQAIFAFPSGLAAGDYHFTIAEHSWVSTDVGKTLTFTLTQAIPEGGQLVLNVAYNATLVGTTISSYASPTTTTAAETVTMTEGDSGTDLGSLTNAGTPANNINSLQKALLGSNEWKTSAQRQWLNSSGTAGSVWVPQTIYDRPPSWATNTAGFIVGLDEDFLSCVSPTTYVTVRNTVSDGGGTDTLTDKFYLPSRTEIFGSDEIANTPEGTLYAYYQGATDADRIKYRAGTARLWRLRTPYATYANYVRSFYTTGALYYTRANYALGFAPACQIDLTKLSNSWLQNNMYKSRATTTPVYIGENQLDAGEYVSYGEQKIYRDVSGTLTPIDPPVSFPDIPTIKGETIIDYDGEPKPSQMHVKYRR